MKCNKLFTVAVLALAVQTMCGQTSMDAPNLSEPTLINPGHFGPNAFPVPDMLDGTVSRDLRIEASASHYWGKRGDNASDLFLRLNIPLFTPRVNLSLWMVPVERWHQSDENLRACRLEENAGRYDHVRNGVATGDVYVSGDIHVITAKGWRPDWTIRAALKTASGNDHYRGRYYDAPGYFFDTSVAETFRLGSELGWNNRLRVALSTGFLCWQSGTGRQNDAVMYGVMVQWENKYFTLSETFGGYSGWEGEGDKPMTLKTQLQYHLGRFDVLGAAQFGLQDWNYRQLRIGVAYHIDILKKKK